MRKTDVLKTSILWVQNMCHQISQISLNFKVSCCDLKIGGLGAKLCVWLFYYFKFERNYDVLKSKSPRILLNKNINFNKNETEWKMKNPTHSFRKNNLVLQCKQNYKLKVKLWCVGARERKKGAFLYRLFCPKGIF